MREEEIIRALLEHRRPSENQINRPFESDAEIVRLGSRTWAFTADDYSGEDLMGSENPRALGRNLAVGTLSDLLAVGAEPRFLMQSVIVDEAMDRGFLEELSLGIQEALGAMGAHLLGGDVGTGREWRYTGFGIGTFPEGTEPLSRLLRHDQGIIGVTGTFGDANAAALTGGQAPPFEVRLGESRVIRHVGGACIDTSDGLVNALVHVAALNPGYELAVDLEAVPYADSAVETAKNQGLPKEAFLIGGAGEYELLFFTAEEVIGPEFRSIGRFHRNRRSGLFLESRGKETPLEASDLPDPRDVGDRDRYIRAILRLTETLLRG
jgi:thiamine-monophosphate kinase